jgi:hypothetical protein
MRNLNLFLRPLGLVLPLALLSGNLFAQNSCDGERYRYTSAFDGFTVSYDNPYGENTNSLGLTETLVYDLYLPEGDVAEDRALVVMAHGGFFLSGANDGEDVVALCEDLAQMGYVVASISYRLGIDDFFDVQTSMIEAVWRGVHDSRAAVRYFRKTVEEEGNPYGIDPDRILIGGVSAGGFVALHHAYVDEEAEIPSNINQSDPGLGGGLEGESGNPGYSSDVFGVFNICGALRDADWIVAGDEPLVSVHGTEDGTVPYATGMIELQGFPIIEVDGSQPIHEVADAVGLEHCFHTLEGLDHVAHIGNPAAYDATLAAIAGSMSGWLCNSWDMTCETYDYTSGLAEADWITWSLYPNPLNGSEALRWDAALDVRMLEIHDIRGRSAARENVAGRQEATLNLSPGVYLVSPLDAAGERLALPAKLWVR